MKKCFVYARVSTDEQASGEYSSIESQIDICKHYIEVQREQKWQYAGSYKDPGFSGKDLDRPGIQELLADIKAGRIDIVIVYKIERLVRSIKDFYKLWDIFQEYKVDFVSATQQFDTSNATGKLMLNILLSFAQYERENTAEKTRDKMRQRARLGKWHGGWMPYGYNYNKKRKKLEINQKEAKAVKTIYAQYNTGQKPAQIANNLNSAGFRTKTRTIKTKAGNKKTIGGNRFNEDIIKNIISNPIYKGYVHLDGKEFKGEHKGIITEATWQKANKQYTAKTRRPTSYAKDDHTHLLKGIFKCGQCNCHMTPYPSGKKDKTGKPYLYYACGKVVDYGKNSDCKVRMIPAREFETIIKQALQGLGQNKALINSAIKNTANHNAKRLKPLQAEQEQTQNNIIKTIKEINRLVKIMKSQDMVGKEIKEEYKTLLEERNRLETNKQKLELDIERCKQDTLDAENIAKTLQAFHKVISALPIDDQKELFQLLIRQITIWHFDPKKEKAPQKTRGAFTTKIRTKWYKIKLDLYQFPEISSYYKTISKKPAGSDIKNNWLPG